MYVYTTINTQIFLCKNVFTNNCMKKMFIQILIICNVKVNVSPLKSTCSLLSSSK